MGVSTFDWIGQCDTYITQRYFGRVDDVGAFTLKMGMGLISNYENYIRRNRGTASIALVLERYLK